MSKYHVYRLLIIVCISISGYPANATGVNTGEQPPLRVAEFEQWVANLASEAHGNRALLASKLQADGFTCKLNDAVMPYDIVRLRCVRFGCEKLSGLFWRGALLQWFVQEFRGKFDGTAMSYSWVKGCFPPDHVEQEQKSFISQ